MGEMKRILAVAVGPDKDLLIRSKDSLGEVRPYIAGLVEGLANLNHQLGSDFEIDYRQRAQKELENARSATRALSAQPEAEHDLIFAMSTTALRAAKGLASSAPIVFPSVSDHKADGYSRLGNATGISAKRSQTAGECFERFLATVPTLKQVRVLHKPGYPPSERALKLVKAAAKKRGVAITPVPVKTNEDVQKKLSAMAKRDLKKSAEIGILVLPVDVCFSAAATIIDIAQGQKNLPTFFPITDWVKRRLPSALGGYGVPQRKCGELAAEQVDQILWGNAKASSLKVRTADPDAFEWVVSIEAAEALNIKLPRTI